MKKAKSIIIFVLALLPLIVALLPYVISFGAESRPEMPAFGAASLSIIGDNMAIIDVYDARYTADPYNAPVEIEGGYHAPLGVKLLQFFSVFDGNYFEGDPFMSYEFYDDSIDFAFLRAFDMAAPFHSIPTNVLPYYVAFKYSMYLFALSMIDMCVSLITFIPRKCKELFDK